MIYIQSPGLLPLLMPVSRRVVDVSVTVLAALDGLLCFALMGTEALPVL